MNKKKSMIITGASSGLGKCLYKSFSKTYNVINISRTKSASKHNIITNLLDLSALKTKLEKNHVKHDLCILNAGIIGNIDKAHLISDQELIDALKVNLVANKVIIDWSILNGCKFFIGISSGAATKNYDGWLNYCVTKSAFRSMLLQYKKDLPNLNIKLISPGILNTEMNKTIKDLDVKIFPDMQKFHLTPAIDPQKASELIYKKYNYYFKSSHLEIDLRNDEEW